MSGNPCGGKSGHVAASESKALGCNKPVAASASKAPGGNPRAGADGPRLQCIEPAFSAAWKTGAVLRIALAIALSLLMFSGLPFASSCSGTPSNGCPGVAMWDGCWTTITPPHIVPGCTYSGTGTYCTGTFTGSCSDYGGNQGVCQGLGCTFVPDPTPANTPPVCELGLMGSFTYDAANIPGSGTCSGTYPVCDYDGLGESCSCLFSCDYVPAYTCTCNPSGANCITTTTISFISVQTTTVSEPCTPANCYSSSASGMPPVTTTISNSCGSVAYRPAGVKPCAPKSGALPGDCHGWDDRQSFCTARAGCTWSPSSCTQPSDCPPPSVCLAATHTCGSATTPPAAPDAPAIAPSSGTGMTVAGSAACTVNCPPSAVPIDPVTSSPATVNYMWYKNGAAAQGAWGAYSPFDCISAACAAGDRIHIVSEACGTGGCSQPSPSNTLTVQALPAPSAPSILPIGSVLVPLGAAQCTNCPVSGTGSLSYIWYKNGAAQGAWGAFSQFSCQSASCAIGDTVQLRARSCASSTSPICGAEAASNTITVVATPPPSSLGGMNGTYSVFAILSALLLIALGFMATYVFQVPQIRTMLQDELAQVIASGAILLLIAGIAAEVDGSLVPIISGAGNADYTGIGGAIGAASAAIGNMQSIASAAYDNAHQTSLDIGREGSKSMFCTFLGAGFSLNNCGQLNAFRGGVTTMAFVSSAALADAYAQQSLLSFMHQAAFNFFIPIGLFFRCFKASRSAGGALIAIGFGFYTVYPIMTVAMDNLHKSIVPSLRSLPHVSECDPEETDNDFARAYIQGYADRMSDFGMVENITYDLIVRIIFSSAFNLMVTLAFIRAFSKMIGSEIDVSSLARIS